MKRIASSLMCLLLAACAPPPTPARAPSGLEPIVFRSTLYLAGIETCLTIDPAGRWERVRTTHTHAGSNETPAAERHERTTGQLTPTQLADLRALFSSWNSLGDTYPGVADGPEWEITYGGKAVHAGSAAPAVVRAIVQSLDRIGG